jgi:hypothetical protein
LKSNTATRDGPPARTQAARDRRTMPTGGMYRESLGAVSPRESTASRYLRGIPDRIPKPCVASCLPLTYLLTNRVGRTRFATNTSGLFDRSCRVGRPVCLSMAWRRSPNVCPCVLPPCDSRAHHVCHMHRGPRLPASCRDSRATFATRASALCSLGCDFYAAEGSCVNSPSAIIASSS